MNSILNYEQLRLIVVTVISTLLGMITPTNGFVLALIIMSSWNIWCGMRADGVVIHTCKNFNKKKFRGALKELLLYIAIIYIIHSVMVMCGDKAIALYAVKSITYVFAYVYLQHSFRNLTIAYPNNLAIWVIYLVIRLEFKRAMPSHIKPIIEQYEQKKAKQKEEEAKNESNN